MCVHTHLKLFAFLHWGFLDISSSFLFLPSLCSRDEGDKRVRKRRKKRRSLMEPRADAPWEWQPLPKIRRETKTRIQAKIKQKGDSERREPIFGSFSLQVTLAACLIMLKKGGLHQVYFNKLLLLLLLLQDVPLLLSWTSFLLLFSTWRKAPLPTPL